MNAQDPAETFRVEARELLEQIEQDLLNLADRPDDPETINAIFRGLHTLKGSGAMFGFDALAAFTHHCESAFDQVRRGDVAATSELISAVLAARDHMRALAEGGEAETVAGDALLANLHRAVASAGAPDAPAALNAAEWLIRFSLPADALRNGVRPLPLLDELRAMGPCDVRVVTDQIPPLDALTPKDCFLGWEVRLTTEQPRSAIEDVFIFVIDDMTLSIEQTSPPVAVAVEAHPADAPAPSGALGASGMADAKVHQTSSAVRVPAERLDELMDRVGELVIAQSRLKQVAAASGELQLRSVAEEIEQLAAELRDIMMVVRMVPIAQLFGRFRRLVHDLARDTGKAIELTTEGETTELDKTIIERLADPLVHLIRNAADHGLEGADDRIASGKPAAGCIHLSALQTGAEIVITIADDGRGINLDRVRGKAEEAGLIAPGATLSERELIDLIFQPGFSTAGQVTNLSGRGVGMDVVKRAIEALRGSIEMTSTPGAGSKVQLRIPLTLAIIDGLLVRVGRGRYVIPLSAVEECVELTAEQDMRSTGRSFLTLRDELVPFIRLRELFATREAADEYQKVVVVSTSEGRVGLSVDQIIGDHQTVIKSLSSFHAQIETFSGATIMGDGGVALILDVSNLVAAGQRMEAQYQMAS
jgi:two-component system chemotaxis sensor kinase CheA